MLLSININILIKTDRKKEYSKIKTRPFSANGKSKNIDRNPEEPMNSEGQGHKGAKSSMEKESHLEL